MKARTKLIIALGLLGALVARELGVFDFSLSQTTWARNSTSQFSTGKEPTRAYSAITVNVLEPGNGEPEFLTHPSGTVTWTVVMDEPEFGGLQWLPLYKRMTYRIQLQAGNFDGVTVGGEPVPGKPEDGSPHGYSYTVDGTVTAIGFQSRRGLRDAAIESAMEDVRKSLSKKLLELEPEEE